MRVESSGRSYYETRHPLIRRLRSGELGTDSGGRFQKGVERLQLGQFRASLPKRRDLRLRRDVTNQRILRERTPAQSAQRRIKAATAGIVCTPNLARVLLATAVQVGTNLAI